MSIVGVSQNAYYTGFAEPNHELVPMDNGSSVGFSDCFLLEIDDEEDYQCVNVRVFCVINQINTLSVDSIHPLNACFIEPSSILFETDSSPPIVS